MNFSILSAWLLQERLRRRKADFDKMDTNGNGTISFDEWLDYAYKHIVHKAAQF